MLKKHFPKFIFVILGKRRYNLPKDKDVVPAEIFMLLETFMTVKNP